MPGQNAEVDTRQPLPGPFHGPNGFTSPQDSTPIIEQYRKVHIRRSSGELASHLCMGAALQTSERNLRCRAGVVDQPVYAE